MNYRAGFTAAAGCHTIFHFAARVLNVNYRENGELTEDAAWGDIRTGHVTTSDKKVVTCPVEPVKWKVSLV